MTASGPEAFLGKAPPPIVVAEWVKGEPLERFEPGTVYVVDFWATWCGPCIASIPHLTKLRQEMGGRVEVVGISISERRQGADDTGYIEHVREFVANKGDRMDYRVGVDTVDQRMHETWFKNSGTGGIPTAWIIDQKGRVAWIGIGSPRTVERIVGEVLAGTFDREKEAERQREEEARAKERSEADIKAAQARGPTEGPYARFPGYKEAMERGDQGAALASLEAAFKADPASETGGAYQWKIMILLQRGDVAAVDAYARELLDRYTDNDDIIGFVSAVIVSTSEKPRFDTALALEAAQKAASLARPDSRWAQFTKWRLGWAYYHAGDREKAIEAMKGALDGVRALKSKFEFNDLDIECEDALKLFATPTR